MMRYSGSSAASMPRRNSRCPRIAQRGTTTVEVALLSLVFFVFVFGIMEVSRTLYVFNTIQEVTRRAAAAGANVYPNDTAAIDALKQDAVFRDSPGGLMLAPPITDKYLRLEYLKYDLSVIPTGSWPNDAATNRLICGANSHASNCIRFVQAELCDPANTSTCTPVTSAMLIPLVNLPILLDRATTIVPIETLGYVPGTPPPCACP